MNSIKEIISIPFASGSYQLLEEVTLSDLLEISEPIIDEAIKPIDDALEKANLQPSDIDLVILAGGSSQLPGVFRKIREKIGIAPRIIPRNLMLAISYGATLYQKELASYPKLRKQVKILGNSIGIQVYDGGKREIKTLLNYNEKLPCKTRHDFPLDENQQHVTIKLMTEQQGAWKNLKERNIELNQEVSSISVEISVDENRLIEISVYDKKHSNQRSTFTIDNRLFNKDSLMKKQKELGINVTKENTTSTTLQPFIGIDLGTTTSELTYVGRTGEVDLKFLENKEKPASVFSDYCFPSIVYFPDQDIKNAEVANNKAYNALSDGGANVYAEFKIADKDKVIAEVGNQGLKMMDLSGILLSKIWNEAQNEFPTIPLKSAVVTVPAAFDFDACEDTFKAAKIAGIENVTLIDEPTAAFIYYKNTQKLDTTYIKNVMVFDFGGGTTDVAILDVKNENFDNAGYKDNIYKVLGVSGNDKCGGKYIDDAIVEEIKTRFETKYDAKMSAKSIKTLKNKVETVKVKLSEAYYEMGEE